MGVAQLAMATQLITQGHRGRVMSLYKSLLVTQRNWANNRELFCEEALKTRVAFKSRMGETQPKVVEAYCQEAEAMLAKYRHPDPYTAPTAFGGSKYMRNAKPPLSIC